MKKFIISILLFFVVLNVNSNCKIDTIYYFDYINGTGPKVLEFRHINSYNSSDSLIKKHCDMYNSFGNWENYWEIDYSYNSDKQISVKLEKHWNNNTWVNGTKIEFTYLNGNLIENSTKIWNSGNWINSNKYNYEYDINNRRITRSYWSWDVLKNSWIGVNKYSYVYNQQGSLIESIWYSFDSLQNSWTNLQKIINIYANSLSIQEIECLWNQSTSAWDSINRVDISYNQNQLLVEKMYLHKYQNNPLWIPYKRNAITYNSNNYVIEDLEQTFNSSSQIWTNYQKFIKTYDSIGGILTSTNLWWVQSWKIEYQDRYSFNSNGDVIENSRYDWSQIDSNWNLMYKYINAYDLNTCIISKDYYQWDSQINNYSIHNREEYMYGVSIGISEKETNEIVYLCYPNPIINGMLNINIERSCDYSIHTISGNMLKSGNLKGGNNQIDMQNLANGIYIIRVANSCSKIIIQ